MRSLRLNPTMVFAGTVIVLMTVVLLVGAAQDRGAVTIDRDDIGGVVTGPGRSRGGRVGDRRDDGLADPVS